MNLCDNIRFNNGKLQVMCCGAWTDVSGQSSQGIGGSQPGPSDQPPANGGCMDYQGNMGGAAPWYVPTVVSSGDTINVHDLSGAFYDNFETFWFCPDGGRFFVECSNQTFTDAGSQMPAVPIGRIVAKIGTTYYDILGSTFTVPSGHSNDPVQLEMNTPTRNGSGGDVSFTVTVCNNQPGTWTHTFNFQLGPQGFLLNPDPTTTRGVWTAGQGWQNTDNQGTLGEWFRGVDIILDAITPFDMASCTLSLDYHKGTFLNPTEFGIGVINSNGDTPISILNPAASNGDGQVLGGPFVSTGVTSLRIVADTDSNATTNAGFTGSCRVYSMTVQGTGVDPF